MTKLSPVKIEWASSSSNLKISPAGEEGKEGCTIYVDNVQSSGNNRGERVTLTATVTYLKTSRKGVETKTKIFKKTATAYNLSYAISIDSSDLSFTQKGQSVTLNLSFNDGNSEDQPTNKNVKWMITDAEGNKSKNGTKIASVSSKGVVKPKGPGATYITVCTVDSYVKESKTYKVMDTISVLCMPVQKIGFEESSMTLSQNGTANLKEKLVFNEGKTEPYNKENLKLKWISSDKKNVSVNSKGVIKINKKASAGSYTIKVQATGGVQKGETVPEGTITINVPAAATES